MSISPFALSLVGVEHTKESWLAGWAASGDHTVAGPLGIELVDIDDDGCVLRMPITNATRQPFGLLHGGVSMVLAETAASMHACWKLDVRERVPVGIEINGSHLRSATEGYVIATCRVVRKAYTLIVHEIELHHEASGDLLNVSRVTNLYTTSPMKKKAK